MQAALDVVSSGLTCSMNLGACDVYPKTSGKDKAAEFIMHRLGADPEHCRLLCDDHNDLRAPPVDGLSVFCHVTLCNLTIEVVAAIAALLCRCKRLGQVCVGSFERAAGAWRVLPGR